VNAHIICFELFLIALTTGDTIHFHIHVDNQALPKARNHFAHHVIVHQKGTNESVFTESTHSCVTAVACCLNHFAFFTSSRALGRFTADDNADHT
jgi:hypothetical protein